MIKDNDGNWLCLVSDLLALRNAPQDDVNLVRRINTVYAILANGFSPDDHDICRLEVKRYFPPYDLERALKEFMPRLPYTCRGVYFKPFFYKFRDILLNFDDSLIKKIVRTSFKDQGNFLLLKDKVELEERQRLGGDKAQPTQEREKTKNNTGAITLESYHMYAATTTNDICVHTNTNTNNNTLPQLQSQSHADSQPESEGSGRRVFWVRNTNLPDVYELYESSTEAVKGAASAVTPPNAQIACIPSLQSSKYLRGLFATAGVTDVIPMECVFSPKFEKWTPVAENPRPNVINEH
jgi:hypothetical protein